MVSWPLCLKVQVIEEIAGDTKLTVTSNVAFSKRYVKYLTKKFLKKNLLRDWIRVVATTKDTYALKFYNVSYVSCAFALFTPPDLTAGLARTRTRMTTSKRTACLCYLISSHDPLHLSIAITSQSPAQSLFVISAEEDE
jgi:hypothetical protein